ncbi:hypothetical protein GCM10010156_66540 [Planobispora rosea]|uniref:Uncharacterized protein n=1 Tax=Planobispora rosea TaxID=35762 RepID=A0A8J3S8J9_PLARO|nr:hypothetical protein [Planobispora rosea]GGS99084.1 hypothetical protein GCM10010156_66540 [Planobispora rosea]GIH88017.1 hypothetical protein Pro02_64250 [Planobispora rosea]
MWDETSALQGRRISYRDLRDRIMHKTGVEVSHTWLGRLYNAVDLPPDRRPKVDPKLQAAIARGLGYEPEVFTTSERADRTLRELEEFRRDRDMLKAAGLLDAIRDPEMSVMTRELSTLADLPEEERRRVLRSGLKAMLDAFRQARGPAASARDADEFP